MAEHDRASARILVYGSCVARDTVEFAASDTVDLRGYIARQSLISAGNDASTHLPEHMTVSSKFQERMIRADFSGGLFSRLETLAADVDVLLWDLADERHGVYRFADGTVATRSIDTIRIPELEERFAEAEHIEFGTDEHFAIWSWHVHDFVQRLRALDLFVRTVVLEVPWAVLTTEGKPSPWSMGVRAAEANKRYRPYYDHLRSLGFRMVELPEEVVLADPEHKWGLAPFHYTPAVYREVLRQLREVHGVAGLEDAGA
ncbi:hypothetical protein FQ330_03665 [Agrococcus sediminis]|uniref:SGNH/GDSL hydrolase family protein n=1 Tax=Agrococcus sediminis TaxID=2599924 RepID=A0A5M8QFV6_9MICO|nr:DUF6270 domain-containing protein [Agrococcus sediminis]KAA6434879.1 hypothetical protein FQ330_03665 [Agrococcus sediminis]